MGLTVTEDTPADMLAGNMELLVQLPPRIDEDYDNDDVYDRDEDDHLHQQHRNHHRHHNHHHNNGHHQRRTVNGNARRVTVARSTPMMDLLVQVATSQKLSASSYTLEAIGEHGLVLTHHPNTPIGALDALQVKLLPKQGTFLPMKTRHVNQPFEQTFRLQVHLPRNQLYVSRVSSRMNLGKILDDVCREKNLDRNNYELCHPANIEETLDLSLSLQDYHLQEVTLCPKRRSLGSSLSSQDIMALQRQEERRRQDAKQSVFGFAFKKSKESSLSTDSLGERSVSPARSDGTGRSASPQAPTAPTRPQRKRRPAPKPPMPRTQSEQNGEQIANGLKETARDTQKERENAERIIVISHSRNSSDSSGYHEASVLSDNLDSNIRVPETLPRRSRLQITPQETSGRTLAESSQASKSLGNLAAVPTQRATIARGTSNSSLISAGLRKKKAAPAPPQPSRPLSSAISTQALERIVDSEESSTSVSESFTVKSSPDFDVASKINSIVPQMSLGSENEGPIVTEKIEMNVEEKNERRKSTDDSLGLDNSELDASSTDPSISNSEIAEVAIIPNVDPASEHKRAVGVSAPVPKPRRTISRLDNIAAFLPQKTQIIPDYALTHPSLTKPREPMQKNMSKFDHLEIIPRLNNEIENNVNGESGHHTEDKYPKNSEKLTDSNHDLPRPKPRFKSRRGDDRSPSPSSVNNPEWLKTRDEQVAPKSSVISKNLRAISAGDDADVEPLHRDVIKIPKKLRRKTLESTEEVEKTHVERKAEEEKRNIELLSNGDKFSATSVIKVVKSLEEFQTSAKTHEQRMPSEKRRFFPKISPVPRKTATVEPAAPIKRKDENHSVHQKESASGHFNDVKKSCAVISTIPKCDNFQSPIATRGIIPACETGRKKAGDEVPNYNSMTSIDSSLGSSFGAGRSILHSNYQRDIESTGTSSMTTDVTNSGSDDELELESFEMFEESRRRRKVSKLVRSHSQLNDFEINTFEGNGRLTSRSEDFTFALNTNLSRNISDLSTDSYPKKIMKRHLSSDKSSATSATKLPAFLATSITWEKREYLQGVEDNATKTWTVGKSGSGNDRSTLSTMPINKSEEETTSDLLKKVSDTLSGSLRSPVPLDGATSSLANEHQINAHCLDQPKSGDGKLQQRVNEARQLSEVNENTEYTSNERTSIDTVPSNFLNNRQPPTIKDSTTSDQQQNTYSKDVHPSSTTTDWEYLLPEPPTAFRDTNVVENREVLSSKTLLVSENVALNLKAGENREEKSAPRITEKAKPKVTEIVVTNGASLVANIRNDEIGHRSRTTSVSSLEIGSELAIDRIRLSRTGIKSSVDTESRRGSQASSTPTVAPVDNTLSNFVITTYSRPKNVDIFNEIEQRTRDPQVETSRKNSASNSVPISGFTDSRKSSLVSLLKDHSQPRNFGDEKSGAVLAGQKFSQTEIIAKGNDLQSNLERNDTNDSDNDLRNTLSRSNIKISIATKPRPRGDSINENQRPKKPVFVNIGSDESSNSREDIKPAEETSREPVPGCNKKLSHWKENILNKQETPSATEKPLQSSQVLKNILPQLDSIRRNSDDSNTVEKANSIPKSEETIRVVAPLRNNDDTPAETNIQQNSTVSSSNEPRAKRYTYAGPPAINLGSWSDRSRTTLVQIKPDNDYKVEKNRTREAGGLQKIPSFKKEENNTAVKKIVVTNSVTAIKNLQPTISTRIEKENAIDNRDKTEPNELAKTLIARTTATGFKRPVSMIVQSSGTMIRLKKEEENNIEHKINGERDTQRKFEGGINGGIWRDKISAKKDEDEEERDDRPRNFKELKEAFAKDQNANSISMPKYGTYGRRSDNSTTKSTVRRESNISLNGDDENTLRKEIPVENCRINKSAVSVQDKRNFVVIPQSINRNGIQDSVKRPSRGNLMPVVKGFKVAVAPEDEATFSQDKRPGFNRIAIGDISNANYMIPSQNGLRKTTQIKLDDSSSGIPKPPPTMPVITGVTLKSINHKNFRPKSMPAEPDTRNQLLESIRNFGGQNQLRRAPRRNTNIVRS